MNLTFFRQLLNIDSTTQQENALLPLLINQANDLQGTSQLQPVVSHRDNLLITWGTPKLLFSTHMDTVPPYFPVSFKEQVYFGRGTVDAKGQIYTHFTICQRLLAEGYNNFGLLLVVGEETDSCGAKLANQLMPTTVKSIVIGEPTNNQLVSATKGTYKIHFETQGNSVHSGYPATGEDALRKFITWFTELETFIFPTDPLLGSTTFNIGNLVSSNVANLLSDRVTGEMLFRTTFTTHPNLENYLTLFKTPIKLKISPGATPLKLATLPGFPTQIASFASDAAFFTKVQERFLFGPGDIAVAHTLHEQISLVQLTEGIELGYNLAKQLINRCTSC